MDRQTFLETLNNRGVPKDQWKSQMNSYRRFSGAFDDDKQNMLVEPPVAFKPNAILNYDPRKNLPEQELKIYNDFTTEKDEYRFIADQFLSSKYQKDISGVMTDIMIRQEMGLEKDEDVNYGAFVTKAKMSYTPESDEWMVSPEERFIMRNPDQEPAFKAKRLTTQQKENQFFNRQIQKRWTSANSFAADYYGTSPIRMLMGVEQIKKDIRNNLVGRRKLNGEMIRGSGTTAQSAQWGYTSVNFNQQYNALVNANRLEEADKLKAEYDELSNMVGSAFDYREKSWYERGLKEGVGTAVPMLETLLYGALTRDKKTLARVVNIGYWANQGAGQVKSDVVGNRKLTEINPNELSEINKISNILSIPYAVTEFAFAAIPSMSSIGSTVVRDTLAKATVKVFNNLGRGGTVARVGATTVINQFGERLEEGIQEFINTTSVELAKKADPEMESVRDTFKEFLKSDFKEAFAKGKEAFEESKYAVMFIGAGGTVVDLVQSNREYQSIQREREYLTQKKGFTDEKALELAIEKHGILGKDKQKAAMVQVKSIQLVDQGVEESEAKRISKALVNAKNKKQTNAALFDFNKVILQSYVNRTRDQINPDLPNELLVDFDVEALAKMLTDSELETESVSLAEELQTEVQTQIDNSLKNLRIKLVTETLANANMDRTKARDYATQLEEETDIEKNIEIRRKIAINLSDLAAEYQMPNMPYSKLGLLTEEDFKQLRETMTDAELQELIDVPLYQLPKNMEELVDVFTRAVNGDKEAQDEYNQIMQDARDIDYDKFLKAFNLVDARFKPTQTVEEQSEADSQPFSLSDEQREQILAGELAVNEVEEIANIRGISIEEARILLIDLIETYGQTFDLDTETETEQEKIVRVEGINNIAVNVTKALAQVAPDVKIITHESTEQFEKATGQKSADGLFIGEVDGEKVIHINSEIARPETVAHEAFHALVNSLDISNIEERLFEISERVKPYLEKEALEELNIHLENYKNESYKGEESLAKMVEILSRNYQALPQTEKNIIIKFLERLIEMLGLSDYSDAIFNLGFKTRKGIPKRDKQVINFLNNLSVSLSEGIEIQDRDLDVLRPDIETLSKKDLVARAKELGVPSYGTKAQILERVRGKFGKRALRASKSREQIPEDVADIIKGLVSKIKEQPLMDSDILAERASSTSLTKADINKTREAYFIDGEAQNEVQHFESVVQRIQQSYTSDGANQLVKSNLSRLRTDKKIYMNPDHVFILALRKDELEREIMTVSREVEEAQANGATLTESNKLQELDLKLADLENLLTVAQSMTSQFARGLRFAQLSQTKLNIYALPRVLESARKQKGSELTKEERQDLTEYAKDIAKLDEEIDFINKTISEAEEQDLRKSSEEFISTTNKKFVNKAKRDKVKIIRERNEYLKIIKNMGFVVNEDSSTVRLSKVDQAEYTPEMRKAVADLARTFVEEGVTDLDDLISKIKTHLPEKSEYDIMNILSNRTPAKVKQVENANKTKLVELKKQARLRAEIKDLLDGVIKQKKLLKPDSAEVSKLKAQLKELRQEILNSDDVKADAIYDRIRRIEEGIEQAVSPRTNKKEESARLQQARQDLRELQRISKIDDQIKELQAQLKLSAKDLVETKKPKKETKPIRNKELEQKIMERAALQAQLRDRIFNMQEKTFGYWYREIAGVPRALLATADMSYLLRQGLIVSAGHPILAAKSFGKAFQAFFSQGNARLFDENLRNMDLHPSRMYYGLELSTMDGALTEREESFATTLLQKIVGVREIVSASERHMVTGLNHLRTGLFDDFISKHPEASEEAKFAYARYVNVATGRGELGQFNGAATALSQAFFSPRFAVSRIQAPAYAITNMVKQPELRGEMARQWLALAGTASAVLALAAANGADVGDDPEDSDFGKFVIGNRRYDIFGGLVQPIRLLMLMIKKNDSEYFQLIYDEEVKKDVRNEMFKFVEYKFNPILSLSHKLLFKEDPFTHKDIVWSEDWKEQAWSFAPIVAQSLKDSYDQEYNAIETASVFIPEFLGVGVGVYEKRSKTKKKPKTPKYY